MSELTVKEYAAAERVDERTVRRWISKGAIPVRRTPGGGIRIVPSASATSVFREMPRRVWQMRTW